MAPNTKFWTRPELRLYVSHVAGNDAVRAAGTFNGRSSAVLAAFSSPRRIATKATAR